MGMMPAPEKCYLTGHDTIIMPSDRDAIEYFIEIFGTRKGFTFSTLSIEEIKDFINKNKHTIKGLILNSKWDVAFETLIKKPILESFLNRHYYPKTPSEKLNNLFTKLFDSQDYDGQDIDIDLQIPEIFYFKGQDELRFYCRAIQEKGLVELTETNDSLSASLTFDGLEYLGELSQDYSASNKCFIAMAFTEETKLIRETIKEACIHLGFDPILIDEVHLDADQTINDGIIAEIKKSRFLIADFTKQRNGVYFESGFALGLGRKVIYCCHKDDFKKSHFDTNHFSHIVYVDMPQLKEMLIEKIEAWII